MRSEVGAGGSLLDWGGLWVALATPFREDGSLDRSALGSLTERVIGGGANGVLALGSTGEAAALDEDEREQAVETVLEAAQGTPVLVGCGSNVTRHAVRMTLAARAAGAAGALLVTPYYSKPNPDGLFGHYCQIAEAAGDFPLMVYNVPGRTGQNLTPRNLARLWEIPSVVAIKESGGDVAQIDRMVRELPEGKTVLAGDDWIALAAIALGARGLVSVAGNVVPAEMRRLVDSALAGRLLEARELHRALAPLIEALFLESNPVPLKAALAILGLARDTVRSPLSEASPETMGRLASALAGFFEVAA